MTKYFVTSKLSDNLHKTPEGFLLCAGVPIARTGDMEYGHGESPIEVGPDGKAIVSREAREVFRPETIASFEGKPFTISHPEEFVNPGNWKTLAKGTIQNVRRGTGETENDLIADILITDHEAIVLVESGTREVSCGYEAEYIQLGIGRGMQTNIIGNHLALVEQGRAGAAYAINDQKGAKMKLSEKVKGIFMKAGDEAAKAVDESSTATPAAKASDEMPAWAKTMQKEMKRVTDALAAQNPSSGTPGTYTDEEAEKKKADDEAAAEKKKVDDEAPAWAKDLKASIDAFMEKSAKSDDGDDDEESEDDDEEEVDDADEDDESEDDDFEETPASKKTGDEASRIEILAPGLKAKGKDAKRVALAKAYESKDNKAIIDRLNGGKVLDIKKASQKTIDHIFVGASEVIGLYRTKDFTKWKQVRDSGNSGDDEFAGAEMTPEKINEMNKKFYAGKGAH